MINPDGALPSGPRLAFRLPIVEDAGFYRSLMNEPDYHRFIADRGIRTDADAAAYIQDRTLAHFKRHGAGLWLVELKTSSVPIGVCGLVIREELDHPDLGYAFLQKHRGHGYAIEAAGAVLDFVKDTTDLGCVCAITHTGNFRSAALLLKLGFLANGQVELPAYGGTSDYFEYRLKRDRP